MPEPERRRRRPAVSCSTCRRRKLRCNRETPCGNCASRNAACIYDSQPAPRPRPHAPHGPATETESVHASRELAHPRPTERAPSTSDLSTGQGQTSQSSVTSIRSGSTSTTPSSVPEVETMKCRIQELEKQLSLASTSSAQAPAPTSNAKLATATSRVAGTLYAGHDSRLLGHTRTIGRSVMYKSRLFGQSHFTNAVLMFRDTLDMVEPYLRADASGLFSTLQRCKYLSTVIKLRQTPSWPMPTKTNLPTKDVADALVDGYMRTTETFRRILHIPTFRRDYEALWIPEARPDPAFLIQVKLVLTIGTAMCDDGYAMNSQAIEWVYEAHWWLSEPKFKPRLTIQALQSMLLLLLAREIINVGGDLTWISAGTLLRTAVYMGLHRDPSHLHIRNTFTAEMRRRIWNTILEVVLESSMTSGAPTLLSLDDFNAEPPANFDDDQLTTQDPISKPEDEFTQTSTAITLRRTFAIRLKITRFLNDLDSLGTYEETLQLDAELKAAYQDVYRTLRGYKSSLQPIRRQFQVKIVDLIMNRHLAALHMPFATLSLHDTAYACSRKTLIETSLKIWCAAYPSTTIMASSPGGGDLSIDQADFSRLASCGQGVFGAASFQANCIICAELRHQIQEEASIGPVPLQHHLISAVEEGKMWALRSLEHGETNVKCYWFMSLVMAQIDGLRRGHGQDEIPDILFHAAEDASKQCLAILEDRVARIQPEGSADELDGLSCPLPQAASDDWDFTMADTLLDFSDTEFMF